MKSWSATATVWESVRWVVFFWGLNSCSRRKKKYGRINSWSHLVFNANWITSVKTKTKKIFLQRPWIVMNHRKKSGCTELRSGMGYVHCHGGRVSFQLQPPGFHWTTPTGLCLQEANPFHAPQHARTNTHTHNSLLEALSIPVQQRNSAYKTFLAKEQDSYEKEEAIPPSSRTVLLCGSKRFVGSIRVWKDGCVIWPELTRPIAVVSLRVCFHSNKKGLGASKQWKYPSWRKNK